VEQYCDLIGERILDAGVSVRKRVIKILREICLQFPEFEKNGELCSRIVKRVNDECEPIRRLVADTCRDLWFSNAANKDATRPRARSLLHVVSVMMRENRLEALQTLFTETLNKSADARRSASLLVSVIVTEMLVGSSADTNADDAKQRLVAAMTTVYMLARDFPSLVSRHVESLQSLLSVACENRLDVVFVVHVVNTLERVLNTDSSTQSESQPILAETLLTRIETDLTKNVLVANALVLSASVRCLATLIHAHTNNVQLAKDLFARFTAILVGARALATPLSPALKPKILRAIYTCGLFAKHFVFIHDLASRETVVDTLVQLCDSSRDPEIRLKSLISLGFVIESDARVALRARVVQIYFRFLTGSVVSSDDTCATTEALFCVQTLNNIRNYFSGTTKR
jgi:cohesin loading factor subunit SCC2